ncbi:MAG: GspE/PulE family protein [bacterium]
MFLNQMKYRSSYKQIGELLLRKDKITKSQLEEAYKTQKHTHEKIGVILVNMGLISEEILIKTLAQQLDSPYLKEEDLTNINTNLGRYIPQYICRKNLCAPVRKIGNTLTVAMADPFDILAIDNIERISGLEILPAIASPRHIENAINHIYDSQGGSDNAVDVLKDYEDFHLEIKQKEEEEGLDLAKVKKEIEQTPVVRLVDYIITNAIEKRASDIHIEPQGDKLIIRYRIDGVLYDFFSPPSQTAIISRIKILSNMDIAERRMPQDGRFTVRVSSREIDLRVSTILTTSGEKVVMRLLEKQNYDLQMEDLGLDSKQIEIFKQCVYQPAGMILLTGPTGSGKSTTLYSVLSRIHTSEKNFITIEDPVEYKIRGINQIQTNEKAGLTFAKLLRSILRQDPDTIMVGEIRDQETAEIAMRAALTGHMVFSTLHTNDAIGTIPRLIDMGIPPFLVCNSLILSVAQRLVRRICVQCRKEYKPSSTTLDSLGLTASNEEQIFFYRGRGCEQCNNTGYYGRTGIFELLVIDQEIKNLILQNALPYTLRIKALENGMSSLRESGLHKVIQGITTLEEVLNTCIEET